MDKLMFLGGLPYSGKTTLGKRIDDAYSERYRFFEWDAVFERAETDAGFFWENLLLFNPKAANLVLGVRNAHESCSPKVLERARDTIRSVVGLDEWKRTLNVAMMIYIAREIRGMNGDEVPIIEGLFYDRRDRDAFVEVCNRFMAITDRGLPAGGDTPIDFYQIPKTMVYIDTDIDVLLGRYDAACPERRRRITRNNLARLHELHTIPTADEMPNYEVVILRTPEDIDQFVCSLSKGGGAKA